MNTEQEFEKQLQLIPTVESGELSFDEWREITSMILILNGHYDVYVGEKWLSKSQVVDAFRLKLCKKVKGMVVFSRDARHYPLDGIDIGPRDCCRVLKNIMKTREKFMREAKEYKNYLSRQ